MKKWEVRAEMPEQRLLLIVNHLFNTPDRVSYSKTVPGENAMRAIQQEKRSQMVRPSGVTKETEVIDLHSLALEVAPPKKAAKIDENSTPRRQRR